MEDLSRIFKPFTGKELRKRGIPRFPRIHKWMRKMGEFEKRWGLALSYCRFDEHDALEIHIIWGRLFINLPWGGNPKDCMMDAWGFTTFSRTVHFRWRDKLKIVYLPWDWIHVRTTTWDHNGNIIPQEQIKNVYGEELLNMLSAPTFDYTYVLKSGKIQHRKARYYVSEMEWRWKLLKWLPWPRTIRKSIDVSFDEEVGEKSGSWKGGCVGCGYDLRKNEIPIECLRRMERERKFD
jgi:hypothetical protein